MPLGDWVRSSLSRELGLEHLASIARVGLAATGPRFGASTVPRAAGLSAQPPLLGQDGLPLGW